MIICRRPDPPDDHLQVAKKVLFLPPKKSFLPCEIHNCNLYLAETWSEIDLDIDNDIIDFCCLSVDIGKLVGALIGTHIYPTTNQKSFKQEAYMKHIFPSTFVHVQFNFSHSKLLDVREATV